MFWTSHGVFLTVVAIAFTSAWVHDAAPRYAAPYAQEVQWAAMAVAAIVTLVYCFFSIRERHLRKLREKDSTQASPTEH